MRLSDRRIRSLKPRERAFKTFDGYGLYLHVQPGGAKLWRLKYRFCGRERVLALGAYPEITLARAREKRTEARRQLDLGIDPMEERKAAKVAETKAEATFELVAREWFQNETAAWAESHSSRVLRRLEREAFPFIGSRPVAEITPTEVLTVVRRAAERGAVETSRRVLQYISSVMRFAVITGRADSDPTRDLRGALPRRRAVHHAAITEPKQLGDFLRVIQGYEGSHVVRCALQLMPHVFVRPGELRHAEWSEMDFDSATWSIDGTKMKTGAPHIVPLSRQSIEILRDLQPLTGAGQWVFPSGRSEHRAMSENGITAALRILGYEKGQLTGHGFRATARTMLDEQLGFPPHLVEHQLAHVVRDPLGRAYNRTQHLRERRAMMQKWSDYLDTLRDGAQVVPIERAQR